MPGDAYYTAHTGHFEWYTPKDLLDKCRFALGGAINLDPFSHVNANESVCADIFLTAEDDALLCDWPVVETMFANPPYALGLIGKCCRRIEQEWRGGGIPARYRHGQQCDGDDLVSADARYLVDAVLAVETYQLSERAPPAHNSAQLARPSHIWIRHR